MGVALRGGGLGRGALWGRGRGSGGRGSEERGLWVGGLWLWGALESRTIGLLVPQISEGSPLGNC